jgi:hypothetical protein
VESSKAALDPMAEAAKRAAVARWDGFRSARLKRNLIGEEEGGNRKASVSWEARSCELFARHRNLGTRPESESRIRARRDGLPVTVLQRMCFE